MTKEHKSGSYQIKKEFVIDPNWKEITDLIRFNSKRVSRFSIQEIGIILGLARIPNEYFPETNRLFIEVVYLETVEKIFDILDCMIKNKFEGASSKDLCNRVSKILSSKKFIDLFDELH